MFTRCTTKCMLHPHPYPVGERPRWFCYSGMASPPLESRECAVCPWSVGGGSPGAGRSKWPSPLVWMHSCCCRWSADCYLLLIINPQDSGLWCLDLWLLWSPCLYSGQAQCRPWSIFADWWLSLISHGGGEEASFIRFSLSCKVQSPLTVFICDEVVSLWAEYGKVALGRDGTGMVFSRECLYRRAFHEAITNVLGPSRSFFYSILHSHFWDFSPAPPPPKALFTWLWKQVIGPFKIIHINMRPTHFFINRSRCFYKAGFQKTTLSFKEKSILREISNIQSFTFGRAWESEHC